jgi:IS30 family transposase
MVTRRTSLSADQRRQVASWSAQGLSAAKIVDKVAAEYKLKVHKSTVNKMLKRRRVETHLAELDDNRKRQRNAKWPGLEAALMNWFAQVAWPQGSRLPGSHAS